MAERRAVMEGMGPLYTALRERFGRRIHLEVVDPRNFGLLLLLLRDFRAHRVGWREAFRTLSRIPVQAVVVNGRVVARGAWPEADEVAALVEPGGVTTTTEVR